MKYLRALRYNLIKLFRMRKGSHQLAIGIAIGFIPGWFPTFGVGSLLSVFLARILGGNAFAALVSGGLGSIIWPGLFYLNYKVGRWFHPNHHETPLQNIDFEGSVDFAQLGYDFFTGAVINSIVIGIVSYIISYVIFKNWRRWILDKIR